jgi:hypothetical protein
MRLSSLLLVVAAVFLASCGSVSAAADGTKVTVTESRSLRAPKTAEVDSTSEDDEERGLNWFGLKKSDDFARKNLEKMLKSKSFEREMFSKWNGHTQDEIIKAVRPNKAKNSRFRVMLLDYLNNVRPKPAQ